MNNYKGPMTIAEFVKVLQQDEQNAVLREQVLTANKNREENKKTMLEHMIELREEGAKNIDAMSNFSLSVREALLTECLMKIYEGAIGYKYQSSIAESVKHSLIGKFIKEQGVDNLISKFKTKSIMLSEFAHLINKYHTIIMESCDKDDCSTFSIDPDTKNDFFEDLDCTDADSVAEVIRSRVTNAVEDFVTSNMTNKMEIKDIMDDSKMRIDSIKTIKDNEKKAQQEAWIRESAQRKIDSIRNDKPKSVFHTMVESMAINCMKDDDMKEQFSDEQGRLDMDSIVESCELVYTLLEMVNTTKMINVDSEYVHNFVKEFK